VRDRLNVLHFGPGPSCVITWSMAMRWLDQEHKVASQRQVERRLVLQSNPGEQVRSLITVAGGKGLRLSGLQAAFWCTC